MKKGALIFILTLLPLAGLLLLWHRTQQSGGGRDTKDAQRPEPAAVMRQDDPDALRARAAEREEAEKMTAEKWSYAGLAWRFASRTDFLMRPERWEPELRMAIEKQSLAYSEARTQWVAEELSGVTDNSSGAALTRLNQERKKLLDLCADRTKLTPQYQRLWTENDPWSWRWWRISPHPGMPQLTDADRNGPVMTVNNRSDSLGFSFGVGNRTRETWCADLLCELEFVETRPLEKSVEDLLTKAQRAQLPPPAETKQSTATSAPAADTRRGYAEQRLSYRAKGIRQEIRTALERIKKMK